MVCNKSFGEISSLSPVNTCVTCNQALVYDLSIKLLLIYCTTVVQLALEGALIVSDKKRRIEV